MSSAEGGPPESQPFPTPPIVVPHTPTLKLGKMLAIALMAGLIVFGIGSGLDWLLLREREARLVAIETSDLLGGAITGLLVFRLMQYERDRRQRLRQKLEVIAQMNHHVRNALQIISYSAASSADKQQFQALQESMDRIQWALREILPKL